jgi:hypothetical protein
MCEAWNPKFFHPVCFSRWNDSVFLLRAIILYIPVQQNKTKNVLKHFSSIRWQFYLQLPTAMVIECLQLQFLFLKNWVRFKSFPITFVRKVEKKKKKFATHFIDVDVVLQRWDRWTDVRLDFASMNWHSLFYNQSYLLNFCLILLWTGIKFIIDWWFFNLRFLKVLFISVYFSCLKISQTFPSPFLLT